MPVLLEGTSVVIRVDAISERYAGFWPRFVDEVPNQTICSDGELARIGFMDTRDAIAYVSALVARGLVAERKGQAIDCVIVEQTALCNHPCPWLDQSRIEFEGKNISVGRLVGGNSTRVSVPNGWNAEVPGINLHILTNDVQERLEYIRSEGMVDVYRDRPTGKLMYSGRTTNQGRGRFERLWQRWLHVIRKFAKIESYGPVTESAPPVASAGELEHMGASYRLQAEQGIPKAQYELGRMYTAGRGVPCDHVQAAMWYRRAADQGFAEAQLALGILYSVGQGVPHDYAAAVAWLRRAAEQGNDVAAAELGHISYLGRCGMPQDHVVAADWFRRAAERGNAMAQHCLATQYRLGQGVPQDDATAASWLRRAANQGYANAQFDLALLHIDGKGVQPDLVQAYIWLELAARNYPAGKDREDAIDARTRFCRGLKRAQVAQAKKLALEWRSKREKSVPDDTSTNETEKTA